MESSTVIAFRALVMLACLIIVPLAAIFGSQFPDVVKSVLVDRLWPPAEKTAATDPLTHAKGPPFSPAPAPSWHSDAPPAATSAPGLSPPGAVRCPALRRSSNRPAPGPGDSQVRHAAMRFQATLRPRCRTATAAWLQLLPAA